MTKTKQALQIECDEVIERAEELTTKLRDAGRDPAKIAEVTAGAIGLSVGLARTLKDFLQK